MWSGLRFSWLLTQLVVLASVFQTAPSQKPNFHDAPADAKAQKNPYQGQQTTSGKSTYHARCAACHGENGDGTGNIPALATGNAQAASDGELFWYITKGDVNNGMPSWQMLPEQDRWQVVNYLRVLGASKPGSPRIPFSPEDAVAAVINAPPPKPPFTDYRYEKPGDIRKITLKDLPPPLATSSAGNGPQLVPRPKNAWPQVPPGFKVGLYTSDLPDARLIRTAPNGDFFLAESQTGEIRVFRGITATANQQNRNFCHRTQSSLRHQFLSAGPQSPMGYIGNTDAVVRFPYQNGDLKARGPAEKLADLPAGKGHWTRDIQFSPDGKKMFVSVGSASNIDDPDTTPARKESRRRSRIQSRRLRDENLRLRHSQLRRPSHQSRNRRILVFGQRTRRARRQSRSRLHHPRARRRLLWLAVVVHGRPPGSAPRRQTSGAKRQSDHCPTCSFIRTMPHWR